MDVTDIHQLGRHRDRTVPHHSCISMQSEIITKTSFPADSSLKPKIICDNKNCQTDFKMFLKLLNRHGCRQFVRYSSSTDMSKPVVLKSNPENGFTTVILNKPPVNSLGMNVMKELIKTFEELVSRVDLTSSFLI